MDRGMKGVEEKTPFSNRLRGVTADKEVKVCLM
jgi:hypothetical protein